MKIVVCIKQVPDTNEVKLDPVTNTLIREGVPSIINPDDKTGIEAALLLKEKVGGTVTAVTMGPAQADVALREALAMGCDDDFFTQFDLGDNAVDPIRQEAVNRVLEAFSQRHFIQRQAGVTRILAGITVVVARKRRRRNVIAAPPNVHLFLAEFLGSLGFVQSLQVAVHAFIQTPGPDHRNPHQVHVIQHDPQGADGALQHRRESHIEGITTFF